MKDEVADIKINLDRVNEMLDIAIQTYCPYELSALTYPQAQTVLTLFALSKLLKSFGLEAPYSIDVGVMPTVDEDKDWDTDKRKPKGSIGGRRARHKR